MLQHFVANVGQQSIMDVDDTNVDQRQSVAYIARVYPLSADYQVFGVSDENFTLENRCAVIGACSFLEINHLRVDKGLPHI